MRGERLARKPRDRVPESKVLYSASGRRAMANESTRDPILSRFRAALDEMFGDRLARVVLFGSRARGEARDDSDYDVAVFLKDLPDRWRELHRLADLRVDFIDETGAFFDAKPFSIAACKERTPLMFDIRRDGLDV